MTTPCALILTTLFLALADPAADLNERGVVGIEQALLDATTIGRVMNLAAHPDDEDGATLAFCRHGHGLRTFAVFANRGEGGQNEIGPELYRELGAIREAETLRACRRVGATAYFLGLEDYGYSKTAVEAFDKWGRDRVTERVVYAIRRIRPDVIFTNHDPDTGHGQHRALAIAARDAFDLAADARAYPEHFDEGLTAWAPTLYMERTDGPGQDADAQPTEDEQRFTLEVGGVDPLRGTSFREQAHRALKEHASQGRWERFGGTQRTFAVIRRRHEDQLQLLPPMEDPFDPVNLTRLRILRAYVANLLGKQQMVQLLGPRLFVRHLPPARDADALAPALLAAADQIASLDIPDGTFIHDDFAEVLARLMDAFAALALTAAEDAEQAERVAAIGFTRPLWASDRYDVFDPLARPDLRPPVTVEFAPRHRVLVSPPDADRVRVDVLAQFDLAAQAEQPLPLHIVQGTGDDAGTVVWEGELPAGSEGRPIVPVSFEVPNQPGLKTRFQLTCAIDGDADGEDEPATDIVQLGPLSVTVLDVSVPADLSVGVVRSYDDTLEGALSDLGVRARRLSADDLAFRDLSGFDAILIDIRAYLVREDLRRFNPRLLEYVEQGGVVGVFYQKTFEWQTAVEAPPGDADPTAFESPFPPFPLTLTRARVVDERAPVTILAPDHPLLTAPNRIGVADFGGWVHERGLYFPEDSYADDYVELLATHDAGEEPLRGGLLVARVGRGTWVYTSLGWYRQWLEGNPGAYRFLANLVSLGSAVPAR